MGCVPVRVARGASVAHRYSYAPPRCRTSQYCGTFDHSSFSNSIWNDLGNSVSDGMELVGFKSKVNTSLLDCDFEKSIEVFGEVLTKHVCEGMQGEGGYVLPTFPTLPTISILLTVSILPTKLSPLDIVI